MHVVLMSVHSAVCHHVFLKHEKELVAAKSGNKQLRFWHVGDVLTISGNNSSHRLSVMKNSCSAAVLSCLCHYQSSSSWADGLCPHTEKEVAVQRWLWYAWLTLRNTPRSTSQRPPGIITQPGQTNVAPETTICWLTNGTVGQLELTVAPYTDC